MAKICKIASTAAFSPQHMRRKTAGSLLSWDGALASIYRSRERPRNNTTAWWRKAWANSINQGSPSSPSKIDTNTPAITSDSTLVEIVLESATGGLRAPRERCSINLSRSLLQQESPTHSSDYSQNY